MRTAWNEFVLACRDRYGVGTAGQAEHAGVAPATFYRRTTQEGWHTPYPGVRVAPWVRPSTLTDLSALLHAAGDDAYACGTTAAWLYGLASEPRRLRICIPHGLRVPTGARGRVRRCRWLDEADTAIVRGLGTLAPPAMFLTLTDQPAERQRALLIDALHRNLVDLRELAGRLADVGPIPGKRLLVRQVVELGDRRVESIFHDLVLDDLTRRGYRPARSPLRIDTPDGRGVHPDVPLPDWQIALEVQGDKFHRTRAQRSADRRKTSQYAGTSWVLLEVDWSEWMNGRDHFLEALDAAILAQVARGIGVRVPLPPHLRGADRLRVHSASPGAVHGDTG